MIRNFIPLPLILALFTSAAIAEDEAPTLEVKADLELFYEMSDDVGGDGDGDRFKSNQLYVKFDGTFANNLAARLVLDGADIVSSDGGTVKGEKIIEEANFSCKEIGGSPLTLVFGKDEMPFGLDYDKYLNDSIAHMLEIDKVWGLHAIVDLPALDEESIGDIAVGAYQHRRSLSDGTSTVETDNEGADNYSARLTLDKLISMVKVNVSVAGATYADTSSTDEATGMSTLMERDNETRLGAGLMISCPKGIGNLNVEYIAFNNMNGTPDYDPALLTIGIESKLCSKAKAFGRWENIVDDCDEDVENDFWTVGVAYLPAAGYQILVEYSNFNSGDLSDATDLRVADGSIDDALLLGVKAAF